MALIAIPTLGVIGGVRFQASEEAALDEVIADLQIPPDWDEISQRRTTALFGFCLPSPQRCPTEQVRYRLPDGPVTAEVFDEVLPGAKWTIDDPTCSVPTNVTGGSLCYGIARMNAFEVYLSFAADLDANRDPVNVTATLQIERGP